MRTISAFHSQSRLVPCLFDFDFGGVGLVCDDLEESKFVVDFGGALCCIGVGVYFNPSSLVRLIRVMEKSEMGKTGDGFIDRSKVRILLCDNDVKSSEEVFTLLCKCSYQDLVKDVATAVKSPRQVIDALNAEGPDIDIILSEVDLPMSKGLKMLKYIMRDKELRRIPVITQDEVPLVVKCLKFGAADYLVKPLRTNELLNLWTHMWRRRRMLGLVEKNIISYDFDLVVSDHSDDANTNSTTLFSDDTDDKSRKSTNPEMCVSTHQEDEIDTTTTAPIGTVDEARRECQPDVPGISDRRTYEMRIGELIT
ncbi:hypothetical protein SASPL_128324 [Salvia splendens]|uniref:Response regulatory domain-containing protein n=1 Tax=Salvia splendens TaxID=180675 RepID=A0A8X8XAU4_SALSN|nr:hypothetical protein SASPL_128324 [Salvia splendens]